MNPVQQRGFYPRLRLTDPAFLKTVLGSGFALADMVTSADGIRIAYELLSKGSPPERFNGILSTAIDKLK